MNSSNSDNNILSDIFYSWDTNIMDDNNAAATDLSLLLSSSSSSSSINNAIMDNTFSDAFRNETHQPVDYNNDRTFYDLFPQEKHDSEATSKQMLHQQAFYNNFLVKPFTDDTMLQTHNKRKLDDEGQQKKRTKKKRKRKPVDPNAPHKPKRITGLNKPLLLSNSLQTIMEGATELSRPEIVKRLWNYIKSNQLQDPADRRFILCDEKLKEIFQKDRVNSFGMNRDLSAHLTKKEVASPVSTAEIPDIMTPSDEHHILLKNCFSKPF